MKITKSFPFHEARRILTHEVKDAKIAIEKKLGSKRPQRGRPNKSMTEKYQTISIRLDPRILSWAKTESKKRRIGYQTFINEVLLKKAA